MARTPKDPNNLQVFRGSRPQADVFAKHAGDGCCDNAAELSYDKLAERTRFSNGLAHSNPTGANDKFSFPEGVGFEDTKTKIVQWINERGTDATISILAIPTYAYVTGVGVHIAAEEEGLTFNLITRNGLVLPSTSVNVVEAAVTEDDPCAITRTLTAGSAASFEGFGALGTSEFIDIFGRDGEGQFSLEADELILQPVTLPASGVITGSFALTVSVSYDIIHRAER